MQKIGLQFRKLAEIRTSKITLSLKSIGGALRAPPRAWDDISEPVFDRVKNDNIVLCLIPDISYCK